MCGSPIQLLVRSAEPAVEMMEVSGGGISKAIAGIKAELHVNVADRFGNKFLPTGSQGFPYKFGLILNSTSGADKAGDKAGRQRATHAHDAALISVP